MKVFLPFLFQPDKEPNSIKYDDKDRKRFLAIAIGFTASALCCVLLFNFLDLDVVPTEIVTGIVLGIPFFLVVALVAWITYLDSWFYLKRLKKYGYEVPTDKRIVSSRLENLAGRKTADIDCSGFNKESILLSVLSFIILLGIVINMAMFYFEYRQLGDLAFVGVYGEIPLLLQWLVHALSFWRQRLNAAYKDDVEIDKNRKNRKNVIEGICQILICLVITLIWIRLLYNAVDYMYKARLAAGFYQ